MNSVSERARLTSSRVVPARAVSDLAQDICAGMLNAPRQLPPKYFYDDYGSQLFEAICDTPEYYPTRTESALLAEHAEAIVLRVLPREAPAHILELGSGSSRKTRHLLSACRPAGVTPSYWPFDVSAQMMLDAGAALVADYPWLDVHALIGDYTGGLANLPLPDDGARRLVVFLGGTLGNFEPGDAQRLLGEVRALLGPDDALLLGVDRVKNSARLEAAYDDAQGLTARFNRNVLTVLNRELQADFPVETYRHRALFDETLSQIEMRLVADAAHRVTVGKLGLTLDIAQGEEILTEISRKFTPESLRQLLAAAELSIDRHFEADGGDYSLVLARPA